MFTSLAVAGIAVPLFIGCSKSNAGSTAAAPSMSVPEVQVRTVVGRSLPFRMEFTGELVASHQVDVRPRVSGYVINTPFLEGSAVTAGALLFEIDARPFIAKHEEAKAEAARAMAAAALAQQEYARAERLSQQDAIATEELERRKADLQRANASVTAALAKQESAALDLSFTKVKTPVAGRVGRALVKAGNLVSGGDAGATLLTTLVTVSPMHVLFHLDEPSYRQLMAYRAVGKTLHAEVRVGSEDRTVTGIIDYIGNTLDPRSGTAQARVVIENSSGEFAPGLFARVTVVVETDQPRLLIPETAVGAEQGSRYVLVVDQENKLSHRLVLLGERRDHERIVTEGLAPGETIVLSGLQRVRPGMTVQPIEARFASN